MQTRKSNLSFFVHINIGDMMKNYSIWSDFKKEFEGDNLNSDQEFDIVIIGGGMTGISTAFHLINSKKKVCLVEKNKICEGVTSRTTGKLTYLQDNIYSRLMKYHSFEKVHEYLNSQIDAMNMVVKIIKDNKIDCDLEKVNSYVFSINDDKKINEDIELLNKLNVPIKLTNVLPDKKDIGSGYYVEDTFVFHPLKYLYGLANVVKKKEIKVFENTKVNAIDKEGDFFYLKTDKYKLKTKKVIMAVHYPYFLFPFLMPFKSYLEKSYIGAKRVDEDFKYSAISISKPIESMRFYNDKKNIYKLYLSNVHNYCFKNNEVKNFSEIEDMSDEGNDYLWSNKDIITNDLLPYIGRLNDNNLFMGTGYNTWGMTNGSLAGKILADMIMGKKNCYSELFDPNRAINLGNLVNFPVALWSSAYSFIKSKVSKQKSWYSNRVRFEKRNGKDVGIYVDDDGSEHIVYNLCPHLKCSLIFNEIEMTWDCPCHGSRFNLDGEVIEGPSNYDIRYKE